ncbi:hypothetical protein HLH36_00785 [Gluconacetobacter aggeris]|uniref:Uncharacterized protein n=1 Tax=Gluconacetobacter aggeris TaxID=1286186 RepID=A0A7W4NUS7_9PROT|nr:hypothetical protein [Gluconacetobacter aggeris]MBB2166904.1 hypothetical protein [Gluconacetobacter aggeris]
MRPFVRAALAATLCCVALTACKKKPETLGQKIDNLGNRVQDTVDPPKGPAERLGREIDRATH